MTNVTLKESLERNNNRTISGLIGFTVPKNSDLNSYELKCENLKVSYVCCVSQRQVPR